MADIPSVLDLTNLLQVSESLLKIRSSLFNCLCTVWLSFDSPAILVIRFAGMSNTVTGDRMWDKQHEFAFHNFVSNIIDEPFQRDLFAIRLVKQSI